MLVMSTQLIGFSIGGVARRFLVTPPSMSMFILLLSLSSSSPSFQYGQTHSSPVPSSTPSIPRPTLVWERMHKEVQVENDSSLMRLGVLLFGVSCLTSLASADSNVAYLDFFPGYLFQALR